MAAATELRFTPPGPGSWALDAVHFPRPVTRYWAEMHPAPFERGYREFNRYYGLLTETMQTAYVDGFAYGRRVPVTEDEVPGRFARAAEVFEGKLWREQLREWDEVFKPASIEAHRAIQAVDPGALSDDALVDHLVRCREHHAEMIFQHMRFTGAAMVALGDFLAHVGDWTGMSPAELLDLMREAAPVSAGASAELHGMIAALRADPAARARLDSDDDPAEVLRRLRELDGDAGAAVGAYLELVGYRLLDGFDISGRFALELPDALLRAIRAAVDAPEVGESDLAERIVETRARVPDEHKAEFDDLLAEARLMYRIRDERGVFSDIWASGLMRRAVTAAGARLAERGRIHEPEHLIDAAFDEICSLVATGAGPSAEELAERQRHRLSHDAKEAPPFLGEPPSPPPALSGLPPAAARMMRAVGIVGGGMFAPSEAPHDEDLLRGLAASRGVYEGPARRVAGATDFDRIVQGDVLVTEATTEAFNILLPLLGAIVTDSGGLLSHSAIVAREYGIPGVVGTRDATRRIADGARVLVNGDTGEVAVLG
jgi:phosphohistidine swiveling domain-containing protein